MKKLTLIVFIKFLFVFFIDNSKVSVEFICQNLYMSKSRFYKEWKEVFGDKTTPGNYLENKRLQRAKELLDDGYELLEVAMMTGYKTPHHLKKKAEDKFNIKV